MCESSASDTRELKLFIDIGSYVNLIKTNCLHGELLVDKKKKKICLKGINKNVSETVVRNSKKVIIPIVIDNNKLEVEFNKVKKDFPTLVILGHKFVCNYQVVVDIFLIIL